MDEQAKIDQIMWLRDYNERFLAAYTEEGSFRDMVKRNLALLNDRVAEFRRQGLLVSADTAVA